MPPTIAGNDGVVTLTISEREEIDEEDGAYSATTKSRFFVKRRLLDVPREIARSPVTQS